MSQEDREIKFISMPRYQMRRHALKKLLKKVGAVGSGKKIYEIGYGAGEIFRLYREMGLRVHGYDFRNMLTNMLRRLSGRPDCTVSGETKTAKSI